MSKSRQRKGEQPPLDLYVSPHLDDVVLSCGGRVAAARKQGRAAIVVSVFASPAPDDLPSPLARRYHTSMGAPGDALVRQREDREALGLLLASPVHLRHLDCIYRTGADGLPLVSEEPDIFRADEAEDRELVEAVSGDLHDIAAGVGAHQLFLPLALGRHRDHVLVRQAGETASGRLGGGVSLLYYEDAPYVLTEHGTLDNAVREMDAELFSITSDELNMRLEAISCYRSQQGILWHQESGLASAIRDYASMVGRGPPAERYWRARAARANGRSRVALL